MRRLPRCSRAISLTFVPPPPGSATNSQGPTFDQFSLWGCVTSEVVRRVRIRTRGMGLSNKGRRNVYAAAAPAYHRQCKALTTINFPTTTAWI